MTNIELQTILSAEQARVYIDNPSIRFVDARYCLPGMGDAGLLYSQSHIRDAVFFDIDKIADGANPLPHMLPQAPDFGTKIGWMGIANHHHVIIYDAAGFFSAPRVWWMFHIFGHDKISILEGGFDRFAARYPDLIENLEASYDEEIFTATPRANQVVNHRDMADISREKTALIIDARPENRYQGLEEEPRKGLRAGHIPGAMNICWKQLSDEQGRLLSEEAIRARFPKLLEAPSTVCYCGSGVTACVIALVRHLAGEGECRIYDGSWAQWGGLSEEYPVEREENHV